MTEPFLPNINGIHTEHSHVNKKYLFIGFVCAVITSLVIGIGYFIFSNIQTVDGGATFSGQSFSSKIDTAADKEIINSIQNQRIEVSNSQYDKSESSLSTSSSSVGVRSLSNIDNDNDDQTTSQNSIDNNNLIRVILNGNFEIQKVGTYNLFCLNEQTITSDYTLSDFRLEYTGFATLSRGQYIFRHFNLDAPANQKVYGTCSYHISSSRGLMFEQVVDLNPASTSQDSRIDYNWVSDQEQEIKVFNE